MTDACDSFVLSIVIVMPMVQNDVGKISPNFKAVMVMEMSLII